MTLDLGTVLGWVEKIVLPILGWAFLQFWKREKARDAKEHATNEARWERVEKHMETSAARQDEHSHEIDLVRADLKRHADLTAERIRTLKERMSRIDGEAITNPNMRVYRPDDEEDR